MSQPQIGEKAAVLGIIRSHRGAMKISSEVGRGSTFKILLPAASRQAEPPPAPTSEDPWQAGSTVLLVDDEELVRTVGESMLRELGCTVITAADGHEALARYTENRDIRVVILDLTMPHLDGEQTLHELRILDPRVRVIMSSGYHEKEVAQRFMDKGLCGFIQKPYTIMGLREILRKAMKRG